MLKPIAIATLLTIRSFLFAGEEMQQSLAFSNSDWRNPGTYQLARSKSTLLVPKGYRLLLEEEANKAITLINGIPNKKIEAVIYNDSLKDIICFESFTNGYVFLFDWHKINPKNLLASLSKNTEEVNKERRRKGITEVHVVGWIQKPTLNLHTQTVYWAIESKNDDGSENLVNSVVLKLGKKGYERVTWITQKSNYSLLKEKLDDILQAYHFDSGHRYTDYILGDKAANYGIASLVATTIGANMLENEGIVILLKQIKSLLIITFYIMTYKTLRLSKKKKQILKFSSIT